MQIVKQLLVRMFMCHSYTRWPHREWFGKMMKESDRFNDIIWQWCCCGFSHVSGQELFMSRNIDQTVLVHLKLLDLVVIFFSKHTRFAYLDGTDLHKGSVYRSQMSVFSHLCFMCSQHILYVIYNSCITVQTKIWTQLF